MIKNRHVPDMEPARGNPGKIYGSCADPPDLFEARGDPPEMINSRGHPLVIKSTRDGPSGSATLSLRCTEPVEGSVF